MTINYKRFAVFMVVLVTFAVLASCVMSALGIGGGWTGLLVGVVFGFFYPSRWSFVTFN